ncbi:hypothetical protein ACOR62_09235 [Neisseria lisongii]|uniref:Lipoprotein n=1 Tax=Neisseria lisongii TaxID=2912188 RepID=A0AAW5AQ95_9NEIS|nr:hypothetical protein [Neisseria lisongii]MCF7530103.1 hypothetical protein [Neisseria lisongii]
MKKIFTTVFLLIATSGCSFAQNLTDKISEKQHNKPLPTATVENGKVDFTEIVACSILKIADCGKKYSHRLSLMKGWTDEQRRSIVNIMKIGDEERFYNDDDIVDDSKHYATKVELKDAVAFGYPISSLYSSGYYEGSAFGVEFTTFYGLSQVSKMFSIEDIHTAQNEMGYIWAIDDQQNTYNQSLYDKKGRKLPKLSDSDGGCGAWVTFIPDSKTIENGSGC